MLSTGIGSASGFFIDYRWLRFPIVFQSDIGGDSRLCCGSWLDVNLSQLLQFGFGCNIQLCHNLEHEHV